jgi:Putative restriction endonuclease
MNERKRTGAMPGMDDGYAGSAYMAPGARLAERVDCPGSEDGGAGHRAGQGLDEHLVEPETRWEVLQGSRIQASPARPPHADRHFTIDYVLGAHLAPGYVGATDLLTRWSSDNDYATDTSVRRAGVDETTGERHLEEMAFEVAYAQRRSDLETRARLLSRRGVRRIFAVFVKDGTVEEWSAASASWQVLAPAAVIADPCLGEPIAVRALLDAAAADESVARALVARRHPVIEEFGQTQKSEGYRSGKTDGRREGTLEALRRILARRGLAPDAQQRARMDACEDLEVLDGWLDRALTAAHADEVFLGRVGEED